MQTAANEFFVCFSHLAMIARSCAAVLHARTWFCATLRSRTMNLKSSKTPQRFSVASSVRRTRTPLPRARVYEKTEKRLYTRSIHAYAHMATRGRAGRTRGETPVDVHRTLDMNSRRLSLISPSLCLSLPLSLSLSLSPSLSDIHFPST